MDEAPNIRKLPFTAKEYPDENWSFILKEVANDLASRDLSHEAFFYEGVRQLYYGGSLNKRACGFLISVTDGHFPHYPFLLLPEKIQEALVQSVRDPRNSFSLGHSFFSRPLAVKGHPQYALLPKLENLIEQVAFEAARQMSEKHEGTRPEDFLPPWTAAEAAVDYHLNKIMAEGDSGVDYSQCSFSVNVDFDYSDKEIVREFEKLIKLERGKRNQSVKRESRGKKKKLPQMFRDLAILRLVKEKNGLKEAQKFLGDQGDLADLFQSRKGWKDAISSAEKELEHLRYRLGED